MDQARITKSTKPLETLLVQSGGIDQTAAWNHVPRAVFFSEGTIGHLVELDTAFAEFKLEMAGGAGAVLQSMKRRSEHRKPHT